MESFEFLGGRYNRPEQIMSGPVQAFRAQSAATGKTVFIHRVSTTEAPEEQASLLKLLTTALVKSSETKRLLLDFGEESGYWYVVTESEPQCALLREWLHLEIEAAGGNARPAVKSPATPATKTPTVSKQEPTDPGEFTRFLKGRSPATSPGSTPRFVPQPPAPRPPDDQRTRPMVLNQDLAKETPQRPEAAKPELPKKEPPQNEPKPGEFTQLFASPSSKTPPISPPSQPVASANTQSTGPEPIGAPPAQPSSERPAPGEFTDFFKGNDAERQRSKQPAVAPRPQRPPAAQPGPNLPPAAGPSKPEPGEFTRFFQPGLPPAAPKQSSTPRTVNFEPTQNTNPHVQRPSTPVNLPPATPKPAEGGEFTQMFSRPGTPQRPAPPAAGNYQPPAPGRSDPMGFAKQPTGQPNDLSDDLFNDKIDIPKPLPSSQPKQSEFTRMFGTAGSASPPVQKQSVVAPPRENPMLDGPPAKDPLSETQPFSAAKVQGSPGASEPPSSSPSEFTRIMQGGYGPAKPAAGSGAVPPAGGAPAGGGSGSPLMNVNVSAINPASVLPHLGSAGGSAGSAHAQASASGASMGTPAGSANVYGPRIPAAQMKAPSGSLAVPAPSIKGGNKKMVILFAIIGLLAILLIVVMLFVIKNK